MIKKIIKKTIPLIKNFNVVFMRWAQYIVPLVIFAGFFTLRYSRPQIFINLQHRVFDVFQRLKPREYVPVPVHVIDIDEDSLDAYGQWPWPRTLIAELVKKLDGAGTAAIAFDAVFAERDRLSPVLAVKSWQTGQESDRLRQLVKKLPDNDDVFAAAMRGRNVITGFTLSGEFKDNIMPDIKAFFAESGEALQEYVLKFSGVTANIPVLEKNAAGNGYFTFVAEADGVVRQVPAVSMKGGKYMPALSMEALRVAQGARGYMIKFSNGSGEVAGNISMNRTGISRIRIGRMDIPTDEWGKVWVYFTKDAPGRIISAKDVLSGRVSKDTLDGAIVIIGTSAAGLKDLRVTPLNPVLPGVEVHANVIEQALLGQYLLCPDWADGAGYLYVFVVGLLMIFLLPRMNSLMCTVFGAGSLSAVLAFSWYLFSRKMLLIDPVCPSIAVGLIFLSSLIIGYFKTESEKRYVRTAFSHYVNAAMVEELAKNPSKLQLGGVSRDMTILFCDIRGFTTISEQYDSMGLTRVINRFLTPMTAIIMDRKGCIDKYIGDCIMAFWNAPLDDSSHAVNACESALTMQERLAELNTVWKNDAEKNGTKYLPINIGVGLNTDVCCVGNLGSDQHFNYSVLGDGVNLASRLEGQSKTYGVKIVIGPRTREGATDYAALEIDLIKVKGKTRPVHIYTLLGRPDMASSAEFMKLSAVHNEMIKTYRAADFSHALELVAQCRAHNIYGLEKLYNLYEERINTFIQNPPGPEWDGVFTATSK